MAQQKGFINRCCFRFKSFWASMKDATIYEGVGAVGVFIGIGLLCIGIVFTIVNHRETNNDNVTSFGYTGPVLIGVSVVLIVGGYLLSNSGNIARIWTYVKKRKQFPYIDYDYYYGSDVNQNLFTVVCYKILKTCLRIREGRQLSESAEFSAGGPSSMTSDLSNSQVVCETDGGSQTCRRRKSCDFKMTARRSHSMPLITPPLRTCKISPDTSGSLSDSSAALQDGGSLNRECVV